ncbi:hypothetical protein QR680_011967 [Steinernema hermaphroditum]|uniref:Uncharacterized protein n=1 Tax=Steinernema hermaphroditum TaxID=289476 RepID=A0AA39I296_9BILA|nr:hypothetical protein QR680_011967 [Steinernema hermaphroditum]
MSTDHCTLEGLNEEQKEAAERFIHDDCLALVVNAPAGTGKTVTLRIPYLLHPAIIRSLAPCYVPTGRVHS